MLCLLDLTRVLDQPSAFVVVEQQIFNLKMKASQVGIKRFTGVGLKGLFRFRQDVFLYYKLRDIVELRAKSIDIASPYRPYSSLLLYSITQIRVRLS